MHYFYLAKKVIIGEAQHLAPILQKCAILKNFEFSKK
jgi:hypothetical protein